MMREAKKMMADPVFQEQCKQYTENEAFQAHLAKTKADLQDANKVKEIEEQMKLRIEAGEKELTELLAQSTLLHNDTTTAAAADDDKQSTEVSDELKVRNYDFNVLMIHYLRLLLCLLCINFLLFVCIANKLPAFHQ